MEAQQKSGRLIRFGVFELDVPSGELRKQGHKIRLEGQPVQVLLCLLEKPGELVTREEIHNRLWPSDTFVNFEHGLNAAVKRLRQALGDSAENPRFVETLPRRGYRFIAPVHPREEPVVPGAPPTVVDPVPSKSRMTLWLLAAIPLLLLAAVLAIRAWYMRPVIRSLAVLPLENLSADPSQEYFSDGMTEELITELGQIRELQVTSRSSVMAFKGSRKPLPEIARDLHVDAVVEGAVLRSGNRVRITAQLILASSDKHLWARSYEGDLQDTFTLQKQVATSIAAEVRVGLSASEKAVLKKTDRIVPASYEALLKGRFFWNQRTAGGLQKAVSFFEEAIRKNAKCAPGYAGLADSYALLGDWEYGVMPPRDAYPKAKAAALKALELDPLLADAHISLAFCLENFDWDWAAAGHEFERGIELNPSYATGHQWYAWHLVAKGQMDRALAELRTAERLDPLSRIIGSDLAEALVLAHRYDEAIAQSRKILEIDPQFALAHYELGLALVQKKANAEGISALKKAVSLSPGNASILSNLAAAYAASGKPEEARKILNGLPRANAPEVALVYAALGEKDPALQWLETAYDARFNPGILLRPGFDSLRGDRRFVLLLKRVGLGG